MELDILRAGTGVSGCFEVGEFGERIIFAEEP